MGLMDFLKRKSPLEKHSARVANKRTQNADRWESIQVLGKLATTEPPSGKPDERADAVAALMHRFKYNGDPTITDGEEKDETFRWICEAGRIAVAPVRKALRTQESLGWGLKCLEHLLDPEEVMDELLALLETMDGEYERDPQRKLQLLSTLEEKRDPRIAAAVVPFFDAINEEARFHALGAALSQENADDVRDEVLAALEKEDSVRVLVRVLTRLAELSWPVPETISLPDGWFRDKRGLARKSTKRR